MLPLTPMSQETKTPEPTSQQPVSQGSTNQDLPKAYDSSVIEQRWARYWVDERLFDVPTPEDTQAAPKTFTMLLPPPNVTGYLHMGHMFEHTESDILMRWHRMRGETALWVPGTDHAGIATQMLVERRLASEGVNRRDLGREAFVARVWEWRQHYGGAILDQMKRLGASVDWSREYFTMDDRLSIAVREAFVRLYEQGLIYRGAYIVNWDPVLRTAVSDLEVQSEERPGKLYHIRYPLSDGSGSIVIATTRPETMLGDTAVAVNPTDDRYRHLIGKTLTLPLTGRQIPILADDWANPEFGTGAVKVTPAHDPNDFAIGQRHNLPSLNVMDDEARMHIPLEAIAQDNPEARLLREHLNGLDRFEAREKLVDALDKAGVLVEVKDHALTLPISQRTGAVIEPRLSMQWFLAVNKEPTKGGSSIAANAIAAVREGHIQFTPGMYAKTYFEWMNNIHDWCISRQLWWGHRIPAWHCAACSQITVSREIPGSCEHCRSTEITQETDVLDTWFSSGLVPISAFGWPGQQGSGFRAQGSESTLDPGPWTLTPDLAAFYPTQLLVTGFDILFFWVARMIMLGCHFMLDLPMPDGTPRSLENAVPFKSVYIHALIRDANREKMSKTKGNVIDPIDVIERFGTDAVRFTLASMASPGTDIAFSEARTEGNRAFANKIWNAARFLFMNLDRAREAGIHITPATGFGGVKNPGAPHLDSEMWVLPKDTPLEARWILTRLSETSTEVDRALTNYRFDEAANAIYQFFWGDLCDWYLELIKLRLNFGDTGEKQPDKQATAAALTTLVHVFESALRLLSPFMPFLTEEIWHALYHSAPPAKSVALIRYPQPTDFPNDPTATTDMQTLQDLIVTIRGLRKELTVPEKESASVQLHATSAVLALVNANLDMLSRMARVGSVEVSGEPLSGSNARSTASFDVAVLYERQIDIPAERERLTKELARLAKILSSAEQRLADESFLAKAPAHIVEGLRKQAVDTRLLYDKTKAALEALG